jgi:predicted short-subunit dehydrogenase-like oxidoreductase (DUF2520 family)
VRIVGPGRAGSSLARALTTCGWQVEPLLGRDDDLTQAAADVDLVVLAVPDGAIRAVASDVKPVASTVVSHLSGSLGLHVLAPHERRGALHPLVPLPTPDVGAERLRGAWYAVAGDPFMGRVVEALDGRSFVVPDEHRSAYHAAACIAANHLVALMGQVERVAASVDVPFGAYLDLARAALEDVARLGPAGALTGPVARGDHATVRRHLRVLPAPERKAYRAMTDAARMLVVEDLATPPPAPSR